MRIPTATIIAVLALLCWGATGASAQTIAVTNTNDSGAGSLRAALEEASAGDEITVPAGTIVLKSAPLLVNKSLTIDGEGASKTAIEGGPGLRVFEVTGTGVDATISESRSSEGNPPPLPVWSRVAAST